MTFSEQTHEVFVDENILLNGMYFLTAALAALAFGPVNPPGVPKIMRAVRTKGACSAPFPCVGAYQY
jgi:hypothetical protein